MKRDGWLGLSLALANTSLYSYLVLHLVWSGLEAAIASALFLLTSTFFLTWNLGYAYAIHRRSRHSQCSPLVALNTIPTVSIIVPAYRESLNSLQLMLESFRQLDYPNDKVELYVCDDTEDPSHRAKATRLFTELGGSQVHYCVRNSRRGFKAGAINDLLSRITSQYCIMLDIDHLPTPSMVKHLVAAKMGSDADFLMFPQYFRNEGENSITVSSSLKQLADYRIERFGRCTTNSAFCVSTNWIAATDTLRRIGGLDESTVTEDLATGVIAHSHGLKIGIVDAGLAFGLAPNTLEGWRKQQYRWSSGTFDVAKTILPKSWGKLTRHQRLDYSLCVSWYLNGLFVFLLYLFPIFTAFGIRFFHYDSFAEFLTFTLSLIGLSWVLTSYPTYVESKSLRKTIIAQASSLGVADVYVKALIASLLGRRTRFSVTDKANQGRLSIGTALRSLKFHFLFLALGVIAANYSIMVDRSTDALLNVGWIGYNNFWVLLSTLLLGRNSR